MKKQIILSVLLTISLHAMQGRPMLEETPYEQVKMQIAKGKPIFLEIGSDTCKSCRVMGKMLYALSQDHPEYTIRFINVKKEREVAKELKIMMIPTQLIYDANGKEVYRHIGVLEKAELSELLKKYHF